MSRCGGFSCWDPEVGENCLKARSRRKFAEREKEELKGRNDDEAFNVHETFCCAKYEPAR